MQNYNQNLPHALSIQHTDAEFKCVSVCNAEPKPLLGRLISVYINPVKSMYCIHCERNVNEVPDLIIVCGDCIKLMEHSVNKSSAQNTEDDHSDSFNRCASKL
jgi:hypothetical protein